MKRLIAFAAALQLTGCASILNPPPSRDPAYAPARPEDMVTAPLNPGSIYQPNTAMFFFEDIRARRVGDTLIVRLVETTNAKKKADTTADRSAKTTVQAPVILGQEAAEILGYQLKSSLEASNTFTGAGSADQSNALTGNVTVSVVEVMPNGNLRVQGEKRVGLNQGNEYIKLSGIVRPVDIDSANTVESTKVADATMIYNGDGVLADANRMGWLQRFFTSVIFPF
jgi:flagellar L-ring protein precursor FlgH